MLKTQKIDTGERKVYILGFIVQFLIDIKEGTGRGKGGTWQSGDGGFADEFGKEYEDVSGNIRFVGFGRSPKGDSSFLYFILVWIY